MLWDAIVVPYLGWQNSKTGSAEYRRIQVEIEDENAKLLRGYLSVLRLDEPWVFCRPAST